MQDTYIDIMLQSLVKKEAVLDEIMLLNRKQRNALEDPELMPDEFDKLVEAKSDLIEQLESLDSGFEKLFENMKAELEGNKDVYAGQIRTMKVHIKSITDKSVEIQAQEARNKSLMTQKFTAIKQNARNIRTNGRITNQYKLTMENINYVEPQFLDDKN